MKVPVIAGSLVYECTNDYRIPYTRKDIMYIKVTAGSFVHESTSD